MFKNQHVCTSPESDSTFAAILKINQYHFTLLRDHFAHPDAFDRLHDCLERTGIEASAATPLPATVSVAFAPDAAPTTQATLRQPDNALA